MGLKIVRACYAAILITCSAIGFVFLIPDVSEWLHKTCWRNYESTLCLHVVGLQAAYRISTINICFHALLSIATIELWQLRFCSGLPSSIHINLWLLKIPIFLAFSIVIFIVPFNELVFTIFYYFNLFGGIIFIIIMFILALDFCHAWKIFWMRNAHKQSEQPTCYVCTWLFVIHFVTSLLYAAAFDIIISFFFFNQLNNCITTFSFLAINIFLCLIAVVLSYHPTLQETKASSQIILSALIFFVSLVSWLALSDAENKHCNMFGTAFSGSMQKVPLSMRSIVCCILAVHCLIFLALRNETISFTHSLIHVDKTTDEKRLCGFSRYHLTMVFASCYFAMAMTNWYCPADESAREQDSAKAVKLSSLVENNWVRFIALCIVSSTLPLIYIGLLTYRICHQYIADSPSKRRDTRKNMQDSPDALSIEVSFKDAIEKLSRTQVTLPLTRPTTDVEYIRIPCFYLREKQLSFWHFPRDLCQSYHGGRNGSNACTIIALIIGRLFSRSGTFVRPFGYLSDTWIHLYTTSIVEGNALYDSICKDFGVLDLSIEEAAEHFSTKLNIKQIGNPLAVAFESDIETVTIAYQLKNFVSLCKKQVILFIHRFRTGSFLIYPDGSVLFSDSHSYGDEGSLLVWSTRHNVDNLVDFLKHVLGSNQNKLATLTEIEYESRSSILKKGLLKRSFNSQ